MQWHISSNCPLFLLLLALLAGVVACEQVNVEADHSRSGFEYYTLAQGQYRIFEVNQVTYNFAAENDTLHYEIKEFVADHYLNQEGDTTYILQRLRKESENASWKLDSVYHIRKTPFQVVELNNNVPVVKLVFPFSEGKTWNSNILNASLADSFRMIDVNQPFLVGDSIISETVTVLQRNIQDEIVRKDIRKEVFGKNIGRVYKLIQLINFCADPGCIGQGIITSGILQETKLKSYGKE